MRPMCSHQRRAFTLVELLVVIGIIAVLIGILLPALKKARESARQVACMSNMRQIASAILQYARDNKDIMPAGNGEAYHTVGNPKRGVWHWIPWQRRVDPLTGRLAPAGTPDLNITYSCIAPYLNAKFVDHNLTNSSDPAVLASANHVNPMLESLFRCPSDTLERSSVSGGVAFRYSYSGPEWAFSQPATPKAKIVKLRSIRPASARILIVDEEITVDDPWYKPDPARWMSGETCNVIAARHDTRFKRGNGLNDNVQRVQFQDCLGNVAFADGHVQLFGRKDAVRPRHTGRPGGELMGF